MSEMSVYSPRAFCRGTPLVCPQIANSPKQLPNAGYGDDAGSSRAFLSMARALETSNSPNATKRRIYLKFRPSGLECEPAQKRPEPFSPFCYTTSQRNELLCFLFRSMSFFELVDAGSHPSNDPMPQTIVKLRPFRKKWSPWVPSATVLEAAGTSRRTCDHSPHSGSVCCSDFCYNLPWFGCWEGPRFSGEVSHVREMARPRQ